MSLRRIPPGPGQESVWDYPRPPRLEASARHIQVTFNGVAITETRHAKRVLKTSHPPVYYIPPQDIEMRYLVPTGHATWCEWKGQATAGWLLDHCYESLHAQNRIQSKTLQHHLGKGLR